MTTVVHTQADAAAIIARKPTKAEREATRFAGLSPVQRTNELQDHAVTSAIAATHKVDEFKAKGIRAVALRFLAEQAGRFITKGSWSEQTDATVWNELAIDMACEGVMVWRDTSHVVDAILALKGEERRAFATLYATREGEFKPVKRSKEYLAKCKADGIEPAKTWKLTDTVADLKSNALTLSADIRAKHPAWIEQIAFLVSETSVAAAVEYLDRMVGDEYGVSFRKLEASLKAIRAANEAAAEAAKPEDVSDAPAASGAGEGEAEVSGEPGKTEAGPVDPVAAILEAAKGFDLDTFDRLLKGLKPLYAAAVANAANAAKDVTPAAAPVVALKAA